MMCTFHPFTNQKKISLKISRKNNFFFFMYLPLEVLDNLDLNRRAQEREVIKVPASIRDFWTTDSIQNRSGIARLDRGGVGGRLTWVGGGQYVLPNWCESGEDKGGDGKPEAELTCVLVDL